MHHGMAALVAEQVQHIIMVPELVQLLMSEIELVVEDATEVVQPLVVDLSMVVVGPILVELHQLLAVAISVEALFIYSKKSFQNEYIFSFDSLSNDERQKSGSN